MQIKHNIRKYDELDFEQLTAEMQALFWYVMHYSNNAGIILLSPSVVKKRLNLSNIEYAEKLIERFCDDYPHFIKGHVDHIYLLTSKILDQHKLPLNINYTRHVGVLNDLHQSHSFFTGIESYDAFFDIHLQEAYQNYVEACHRETPFHSSTTKKH